MPLLGTRGAASAKAFGFTGLTATTGYGYIALQQPLQQTVLGGPSPTSLTTLSTQPSGGSIVQRGIIADGAFIAMAGVLYSTNNGVTWSTWASLGGQTPAGNTVGLNGSIAYNSTGKRAFTFGVGYDFKSSSFIATGYSVTSTGSKASSSSFNMGGSANSKSVLYSPALDYFYVMNYGGSASTCFYIPGSTGTGGSTTSIGGNGTYNAGVSSDGYPIQAVYAGFGTTYYLRKFVSADLSSYSSYGTISDSYGTYPYNAQSPWLWCPVNGRYYVAGGSGTSGEVAVRRSTNSSDPQSLTYVGGFNIPSGVYVQSLNLLETATGHLFVFGWCGVSTGKGTSNTMFTYRSTDGGATWSSSGLTQLLTMSKNFT